MAELGRDVLQRLSERCEDELPPRLYSDPKQAAVTHPAHMPANLQAFALKAVKHMLDQPHALHQALGEVMTEPKAQVWFEPRPAPRRIRAWELDACSRLLYDDGHVYLNGESWRASGADARLMRALADQRGLDEAQWRSASPAAQALLREWGEQGWCHPL
jgi:50S ribosomal protein L16 3-hydroxylase